MKLKWLLAGAAFALIGVMAAVSIPINSTQAQEAGDEELEVISTPEDATDTGNGIEAAQEDDAMEPENGIGAAQEDDGMEPENGIEAVQGDDAMEPDEATEPEDGVQHDDAVGPQDTVGAADAAEPDDVAGCMLSDLWAELDVLLTGSFPDLGGASDVELPAGACEEVIEIVSTSVATMDNGITCTLADLIESVDGLGAIPFVPEIELPTQACLTLFGSLGPAPLEPLILLEPTEPMMTVPDILTAPDIVTAPDVETAPDTP